MGASVIATTRRRTFHKRIQYIQSNHLRWRSSGACPAFAWLENRTCLPPRPRGEGQAWDFLVAFLSCASQGVHPTHPPPGHSWAAQSRRSDEHLGKNSAERTLGGLPLFLFKFSPAAGATSDVEAAVPAALFLFLLPLGRPRPRFVGDDAARPGRGTRATVSTRTRLIDHCRARRKGEKGEGN